MAKRERSATVQLKARMKEPLRARLERSARARGVSINEELISRVEGSFSDEDALQRIFGNGTTLEDLARLVRYRDVLREAADVAGERPDRWWAYTRYVPLTDAVFELQYQEFATEAVKRVVDELLENADQSIRKKGPPPRLITSQDFEQVRINAGLRLDARRITEIRARRAARSEGGDK